MALEPCGTIAAYTRHRRNNETPCDPCREAKNTYNRAYRSKPKPEKRAPTMFPPCKECGRKRRPKGTPAKDYPGYALYANKDLCKACYMRAKRRAAGTPPVTPRPTNCVHCGRDMYQGGKERKPHRDAIQYGGNGACNPCNRAGQRVEPKPRKHAECVDCKHPMRARHRTAEEYPGTKEHQGQGLCQGCYSKRYRAKERALDAQQATPDEQATTAYDAYLRQRRERLARQQRLAQVRRPAA